MDELMRAAKAEIEETELLRLLFDIGAVFTAYHGTSPLTRLHAALSAGVFHWCEEHTQDPAEIDVRAKRLMARLLKSPPCDAITERRSQ